MANPVITDEVIVSGVYGDESVKNVNVRYVYVTDTALTAGLTAAELIAKVTEETLPELTELKYLKTRVAKRADDKFVVVASLRYVAVLDEAE